MAAVSLSELVQQLLNGGRRLDAAHALETLLLVSGDNPANRLVLARIYVVLKENHFRARARRHLEWIVEHDAPPQVLRDAASLLVKNVYLTNGPVEKAASLVGSRPEWFTEPDLVSIRAQIDTMDGYLKLGRADRRRSSPPLEVAEVENTDFALKAFIFKEFKAQAADKDVSGSFFTFGSCFARNVARAMSAAGLAVDSFWVGEEVNTTFSNLNLLRFILGEPTEHGDYYATILQGQDIGRLRASLKSADNVVYTLGVAPAFFAGDGRYIPHHPGNLRALIRDKDAEYRFSTVEENVRELRLMEELLTQHSHARNVFLTVSPVPLAASLLSSSASVDDSESKAILRAAAGIVCRERPERFTYYPSFEAFRWLPCFQDRSAFGADDGSFRHANTHLVENVVSIFLESTAAAPARRS